MGKLTTAPIEEIESFLEALIDEDPVLFQAGVQGFRQKTGAIIPLPTE